MSAFVRGFRVDFRLSSAEKLRQEPRYRETDMKAIIPFALVAWLALSAGRSAPAAEQPKAQLKTTSLPITSEKAFPKLEFHRPVILTHAGDGSGRIFRRCDDGHPRQSKCLRLGSRSRVAPSHLVAGRLLRLTSVTCCGS